MATELRLESSGIEGVVEGAIVVACCHCGEPIYGPREGIAVWHLEEDPVDDNVLFLDYAHCECEARHREKGPNNLKVGDMPIDIPLPELLEKLKRLMDSKPETCRRGGGQ